MGEEEAGTTAAAACNANSSEVEKAADGLPCKGDGDEQQDEQLDQQDPGFTSQQ